MGEFIGREAIQPSHGWSPKLLKASFLTLRHLVREKFWEKKEVCFEHWLFKIKAVELRYKASVMQEEIVYSLNVSATKLVQL